MTSPVVHLELHTPDADGACDFYSLLFGWQSERIEASAGSYLALGMGENIDGGAVEHESGRPLWLPYVEGGDIAEATRLARILGAAVLLEPREGRAGWRAIIAPPSGGEVGLWQPKRAMSFGPCRGPKS